MKRLMFVGALLLPVVAMANPIQKNSPNASQVYGDGSAAQSQQQHMHQMQRQKLVNAPTTNVTVNNPAGGAGAGAGVAAGAMVGGPPVVNFQAPTIGLPSVGASGMDCPTVGVSGGGSGPFGSGGIGPSWISPDCNARKLAELLYNMGHAETAMKVLEDQYPIVREAEKTATHTAPMSRMQPIAAEQSAWCNPVAYRKWSHAEQMRNPQCR